MKSCFNCIRRCAMKKLLSEDHWEDQAPVIAKRCIDYKEKIRKRSCVIPPEEVFNYVYNMFNREMEAE